MQAFFYANNNSKGLDAVHTPGHQLIGELELGPGSYVIFAKADVGTNASGNVYPPPPSPHGGGVASLTFGGVNDSSYTSITPESGHNNESVTLIVAAETNHRGRVRFYFMNPYPLRVFVNAVRIIAIRVESVMTIEVGTDQTNLPAETITAELALLAGIHAHTLPKIGS